MNFLKRFIAYLLIVGSSLVALAMLTGHMYILKGAQQVWLRGWSSGNIDDLQYAIDTRTVAATDPAPWPENFSSETLDEESLKYMEEGLTASFLVIKSDTIVFEKYFRGHEETTLTNSFSMAKSIVSLAVGFAVEEGLIDVKKPLSTYLPRFNEGHAKDLLVEHVLQMRSNIYFGESYKNPFGFPARAYYGDEIQELLNPYRPESEPGTEFYYQSGNTMLLTELVTTVQPKRISEYIQDKLWGALHAENDAQWGLDAVDGLERSFAQFYATTRDFARLGKLFLNDGMVDSTQIVDSAYISSMITPINDPAKNLDVPYYGYQIWLGTTEDGLDFSILRGHRGQYVISVPEKDLIVVRTGYQRDMEKFRNLSKDIYIYIETALKITEN